MAERTVWSDGALKVKMDVKDTFSYDAKDPHVKFVQNGNVTNHIPLSDIDNLVGRDRHEKDAVDFLRKNKDKLIEEYLRDNRY